MMNLSLLHHWTKKYTVFEAQRSRAMNSTDDGKQIYIVLHTEICVIWTSSQHFDIMQHSGNYVLICLFSLKFLRRFLLVILCYQVTLKWFLLLKTVDKMLLDRYSYFDTHKLESALLKGNGLETYAFYVQGWSLCQSLHFPHTPACW